LTAAVDEVAAEEDGAEEIADPFDTYLESIAQNGTYCDDVCVVALCIVMQSAIHVYRQQLGTRSVSVWKFCPTRGNTRASIIVWNLLHPTGSASADNFDALEFKPERNQVKKLI
jgi:hypothetical protein